MLHFGGRSIFPELIRSLCQMRFLPYIVETQIICLSCKTSKPPGSLTARPCKMLVGRLLSFWDSKISRGELLIFQRAPLRFRTYDGSRPFLIHWSQETVQKPTIPHKSHFIMKIGCLRRGIMVSLIS